jgi:hypothetical protein
VLFRFKKYQAVVKWRDFEVDPFFRHNKFAFLSSFCTFKRVAAQLLYIFTKKVSAVNAYGS